MKLKQEHKNYHQHAYIFNTRDINGLDARQSLG
jgi:hypothetical protein